jgi:hypothetical protein
MFGRNVVVEIIGFLKRTRWCEGQIRQNKLLRLVVGNLF